MDDLSRPQSGGKDAHQTSVVTRTFQQIEHAISVGIGAILVLATLLVLTGTIAHMWAAVREWPETDSIFQIVDKLLFVLMLVEILHTVRASITSMHLAVEPFLIVGLIATVRRILVVTLQTSGMTSSTGRPAPPLRSRHDRTRRACRSDFGAHHLNLLVPPKRNDHERGNGRIDRDRTPCAPRISTPSMSAVADGPV